MIRGKYNLHDTNICFISLSSSRTDVQVHFISVMLGVRTRSLEPVGVRPRRDGSLRGWYHYTGTGSFNAYW